MSTKEITNLFRGTITMFGTVPAPYLQRCKLEYGVQRISIRNRDIYFRNRDISIRNRDISVRNRDISIVNRDISIVNGDISIRKRDISICRCAKLAFIPEIEISLLLIEISLLIIEIFSIPGINANFARHTKMLN